MRKILLVLVLSLTVLTSCTDNQRAKQFGGESTETLSENVKLVEVTWKEDNMWVLTRPMRQGESAETFTFKEISSFGIMEGTVIIKESKSK